MSFILRRVSVHRFTIINRLTLRVKEREDNKGIERDPYLVTFLQFQGSSVEILFSHKA